VQVVFVHDEVGEMLASTAIAVVCTLYHVNAYQFLSFFVVPVEQFQQCLMFGFDTEKNVLTFSAVT
jgi:hypothetical protein